MCPADQKMHAHGLKFRDGWHWLCDAHHAAVWERPVNTCRHPDCFHPVVAVDELCADHAPLSEDDEARERGQERYEMERDGEGGYGR